MRKTIFIATAGLVACLLNVSPALAHTPKCKRGFVVKTIRTTKHAHGRVIHTRVQHCVRKKTTVKQIPPVVRFQTKVDPTFTQNPANPMAVTYSYSADATATQGAKTLDLAQADQLPAGVLNFYSSATPGGPEALYCSMNVGDATSDGSCPITYKATGTYDVTTQYIPTGATAVTETDQEAIGPFTTKTVVQVTPVASNGPSNHATYTMTTSVTDQNGVAVTGDVLMLFKGADGTESYSLEPIGKTFTLDVYSVEPHTGRSAILSEDGNLAVLAPAPGVASWDISAQFQGTDGWSASGSPVVSVTPAS